MRSCYVVLFWANMFFAGANGFVAIHDADMLSALVAAGNRE